MEDSWTFCARDFDSVETVLFDAGSSDFSLEDLQGFDGVAWLGVDSAFLQKCFLKKSQQDFFGFIIMDWFNFMWDLFD